MSALFVFGLGYTAERLALRLVAEGWQVSGTVRSPERAMALREAGIDPLIFDGTRPVPEVADRLGRASHVLVSIAPPEAGDPVLAHHRKDLAAQAATLRWIGYLSTVGVYGDHGGAWIDEETPPKPVSERTKRRVQAEEAWAALGAAIGVPVAIFRIAGIYGPGRNQLRALKAGRARRIVKPGQVFNRIHVDDIVAALRASLAAPASRIYNLADGHPAPPQEVVAFAAGLMGIEPPPEVGFDEAEMTEMARSFYGDNKRVSNRRMVEELGVRLAYPDYVAGLTALYSEGEGR